VGWEGIAQVVVPSLFSGVDMTKLGKRQQEVVNAAQAGWRVFYQVGTVGSARGDYITLSSTWGTYATKNNKTKKLPRDAVMRLVKRKILRYDGELPHQNCFDPTVRKTELFLDTKNLP
jgi:hypothetical protein